MNRMQQITLDDGRRVDVRAVGADGAKAVLFMPGTPVAATGFRFIEEPAVARGLRVVSFSRPGYGCSTRRPGRRVVDVVGDVDQVLRHLGIDRCLVLGWSGGGPHALACAARLPQASAVSTIASGAAFGAADLDWADGMTESNVVGFEAALAGEQPLRHLLERDRQGMLAATAEGLLPIIATSLAPVDRRHLTAEFVADLHASNHAALRDGVDGWCDDVLALAGDWGFDLDEVGIPTQVWHGLDDRLVPIAHGRWLASRLPHAELHLLDDSGHVSLVVGRMPEVLDSLLASDTAPTPGPLSSRIRDFIETQYVTGEGDVRENVEALFAADLVYRAGDTVLNRDDLVEMGRSVRASPPGRRIECSEFVEDGAVVRWRLSAVLPGLAGDGGPTIQESEVEAVFGAHGLIERVNSRDVGA